MEIAMTQVGVCLVGSIGLHDVLTLEYLMA